MKRYLVTLLALAALVFFVYPQQFSQSGNVVGQKRRTRKVAAPQAARKAAKDYSRFSHATKEHQEACKTCHQTPTSNWQKVKDFPDVADFPDHEACVRCHRAQFFKGAQPAVCTVCHTRTSPRDEARFHFRNPNRPQQFTIEFPHDKHQDVIAGVRLPSRFSERVRTSLLKAAHSLDDKTKKYNNCEICHVANTKAPVAPATGWIDAYAPPVDTFKASPDNHASCFNCHWTSQEPTRDRCDGCHKLASMSYVLVTSPKRESMKFRHEGGGEKRSHAVPPTECTVCHINITKATTLRGLKPDVPIYPSCATASCHQNVLAEELNKYNKSQPGNFKCTKCHTSDIGGKKPPNSHSLALLGQ